MTVHRWFDNKECPGKYLYDRHGEIAAAVNKRLGVSTETTKPEETPNESKPVVKELYRVRKSWEDVKSQIRDFLEIHIDEKGKVIGSAEKQKLALLQTIVGHCKYAMRSKFAFSKNAMAGLYE